MRNSLSTGFYLIDIPPFAMLYIYCSTWQSGRCFVSLSVRNTQHIPGMLSYEQKDDVMTIQYPLHLYRMSHKVNLLHVNHPKQYEYVTYFVEAYNANSI